MILKTVYGSLMHHRAEWAAMKESAQQAPYNKLPTAPVLYLKPSNTFHVFNQSLRLPQTCTRLQARTCVGLFYDSNTALAHVDNPLIAIDNLAIAVRQVALLCDFTQYQPSFYRPPLRFNAFDGSLALPQMWQHGSVANMPADHIETWVNNQCVHHYSPADWICSAQEHARCVSQFIAWEAGDVLMMGCPLDAPWVEAGDVVETRWGDKVFTRTKILASDQR